MNIGSFSSSQSKTKNFSSKRKPFWTIDFRILDDLGFVCPYLRVVSYLVIGITIKSIKVS